MEYPTFLKVGCITLDLIGSYLLGLKEKDRSRLYKVTVPTCLRVLTCLLRLSQLQLLVDGGLAYKDADPCGLPFTPLIYVS